MDTIFRLKISEIGVDFIHAIKTIFNNNETVEIIIHRSAAVTRRKESREEFWGRIDRAIENVKQGNVVSMTMDELEEYAKKVTG